MKEKVWKVAMKKFGNKNNLQRFIIETVTDIIFLIMLVAMFYIFTAMY